MRKFALPLSILLGLASVSWAAEGLITLASPHSVATTTDRLEKAVLDKGLTVFARINHAAGAQKVGKDLPPTRLLVFGNPKVGTPLMECSRTVGIDLPQKALVWQDGEGKVWLAYNDPAYLDARHDMGGCRRVLAKVSKVLSALAQSAVAP